MKKIVLGSLFISLLLFAGVMAASAETAVASGQKAGVVDMKRVVSESPKIRALQEELSAKGRELAEQLEKDKAVLSAEELHVKQQTAYGEFMEFKKSIENRFDEVVNKALAEVGKEKSLNLILYKSTVAFGGMDITQDVINKLQ